MKMKIAMAAILLAFASGLAACGKTLSDNQTLTRKNTVPAESTESYAGASAFGSAMDAVYGVQAGAAGTSLRAQEAAKTFTEYALANGSGSASGAFEVLASEWLNEKEADDSDIRTNFKSCLDAVVETAQIQNSELEGDVAFWNVVNGIYSALD